MTLYPAIGPCIGRLTPKEFDRRKRLSGSKPGLVQTARTSGGNPAILLEPALATYWVVSGAGEAYDVLVRGPNRNCRLRQQIRGKRKNANSFHREAPYDKEKTY
jgi:hypothetical protein